MQKGIQLSISEDDSAEHGAKAVHHIRVQVLLNCHGNLLLGVRLSHRGDNELFAGLLSLILNPLVVIVGHLGEGLELLDVGLVLIGVILQLQAVIPVHLIQVEKHLLLVLILPVVDCDRVVVLVKAVGKCHVGRLADVPDVGRGLTGFCTGHHSLLVDASEGVDHDFALDGLARVEHDGNSSWVDHFLTLLGHHISSGQPWPETWMRMVPADAVLVAADLLHHVHELLLVNWINGLNRNCGSRLRHGEDIDHRDSVVVNDLAHHQTHDFEWHSSLTMLQHLEQSKT